MLRSLIVRLARSTRVGFALVSNGMVSLASFILSISIARVSSIEVFAQFSFAMVTYLFLTGLNKAALTNTALSRPDDRNAYGRSLKRSSLVSLIAAALIFVSAFISANSFLLVLALTLPGLVILDAVRIYNSAAENPRLSLVLSIIWSSATVAVGVTSLFYPLYPVSVFVIWALIGCICGYIGAFASKTSVLPVWKKERSESSAAVVFSADYLVGSGGAQVTTGLLGALADTAILGAIRGAGTLLGPVNLVSTTARSLLLPFLSRSSNSENGRFRSAVAATVVQASVLTPLLVVLQFIPAWLGEQLLGQTWEIAALAILPMSIDALFSLIMSPAIAGHRVAFAGTRTLLLRLAIGIPRPFIVLYSAHLWGITGAAWAMALIAFVGSMVWWISFFDLSRRAELNQLA